MSKYKRAKLRRTIDNLKEQLVANQHVEPRDITALKQEIEGYRKSFEAMYKDNQFLQRETNRYKALVERLCEELEKRGLK